MDDCYPINNYYLYSIAHPDRKGYPLVDLSKDKEANIDATMLSPFQAALERVIKKVFTHYAIPLDITDPIRATFRSKLWRMGKILSQGGGIQREQKLRGWKEGPDSVWSLRISSMEVSQQLVKRKRQVERELHQEAQKRRKLENDLTTLKGEMSTLQKAHKRDTTALSRLRRGLQENTRAGSSKPWQSYSKKQQRRKKKSLASEVRIALSSCSEHYKPLSIEFENKDTGDRESLDITRGCFSQSSMSAENGDDDKVKFALFVKDRFCLSDEAYLEVSQLTHDLPRMYELKSAAKELNSKTVITPSPGNILGVQQSLRERLAIQLKRVLQSDKGTPTLNDNCIDIKLSGDGTCVGRNLHVLNFTFTLVNETQASSVAGHHTIAILELAEHYDELATGLHDVAKEVSELQEIEVHGQSYALRYYLGGDWKFLALICGLNAANADYSCIWCKCHSKDRWNMQLKWSLSDTSKGARTIDEIKTLSKKPAKHQYGCKRLPLFESIPIDRVIIDTLHLFLRIGDLLINLLILDLRRQDGVEKGKLDRFDKSKQTHLAAYEQYLNDSCRISFNWNIKDSKLTWRDLTGPEKVRLFNSIDIPDLFPSLPNKSKIQQLWLTFIYWINYLKRDDCNADEIEVGAKQWVRDFCSIYQTKHVTPYAHAFAMHVPEFVRTHGNISKFCQQGLEKLNDVTTLHYLRGTNHKKKEALVQMLQKRNRLEDLEAKGYQRQKRICKCSNCGQAGHNKRKCLVPIDVNSSSIHRS